MASLLTAKRSTGNRSVLTSDCDAPAFLWSIRISPLMMRLRKPRLLTAEMLLPATEKFPVTLSDVTVPPTVDAACHVLPLYTRSSLAVVLKYWSPTVSASPSLSTVGSLDLAPR